MSYYDILGITPSASEAEIKTAFRKLAKKHHPDVGGDTKKFMEIKHAYEQVMKGHGQSSSHSDTAEDPFRGAGFDPENPFSDWFYKQQQKAAQQEARRAGAWYYSWKAEGRKRQKEPVSGGRVRALMQYDVEHKIAIHQAYSWTCDGCHERQMPGSYAYYFANNEKKLCKECKQDIVDWFKHDNNFT